MLQACFVAGTPLLTPEGSKRIEEFAVGDRVLSRNELDEGASVRPQRVLQVFVRLGRVLELSVGGQVLGTTARRRFGITRYALDVCDTANPTPVSAKATDT